MPTGGRGHECLSDIDLVQEPRLWRGRVPQPEAGSRAELPPPARAVPARGPGLRGGPLQQGGTLHTAGYSVTLCTLGPLQPPEVL